MQYHNIDIITFFLPTYT